MLGERSLGLWWQSEAELVLRRFPQSHVGRRIGEDETAEAWRLRRRVFGREHTTPGMAEEIVAGGDAEALEEVLKLVEEEGRGPEVKGRGFFG